MAFGKASAVMASAALSLLVNDASMSSLLTFARMGTTRPTGLVTLEVAVSEASHPTTDWRGVEASQHVPSSRSGAMVVACQSGGGRALFLHSNPALTLCLFASHEYRTLANGMEHGNNEHDLLSLKRRHGWWRQRWLLPAASRSIAPVLPCVTGEECVFCMWSKVLVCRNCKCLAPPLTTSTGGTSNMARTIVVATLGYVPIQPLHQ
jgi:Domain of unknown function (DUF4147)